MDAGLSIREVAAAAGIDPSHLSLVERGRREASLASLSAISHVLGLDLSVRLFPGTGPRIRDRLQAPMVEALLRATHPSWKRLVEVAVRRPVRGVIDVVLARPGTIVAAVEVHSAIHRFEQQVRWAREKAEALPSAEGWSMLAAGAATVRVERLLVLRNTRANRDLATTFAETFRAAYPGSTREALAALADDHATLANSAVIWCNVDGTGAHLLAGPPRGVALGRSSGAERGPYPGRRPASSGSTDERTASIVRRIAATVAGSDGVPGSENVDGIGAWP
jgi:transcriptional regulator with XRE-family HTH domain